MGSYNRAKFTTAIMRREEMAGLKAILKPGQSISDAIRGLLKEHQNNQGSIPRKVAKGLALDGVALGGGFAAESISQRVLGHEDAKDIVTTLSALGIEVGGQIVGGLGGEALTSFSRGVMGLEGARLSQRVFNNPPRATKLISNQSIVGSTRGPYLGAMMGTASALTSQLRPAATDLLRKNPAPESFLF